MYSVIICMPSISDTLDERYNKNVNKDVRYCVYIILSVLDTCHYVYNNGVTHIKLCVQ